MKNNLWGTESFNNKPIHVVLFTSRNKDNKDIESFKERRMSFITHEDWREEKLYNQFLDFANHGLPGEMSRMYYSVNARNGEKIHRALLHFLFDNPDFNLCSIQPKLAGIAAQKDMALEKKWMFDFDRADGVFEFMNDINDIDPTTYPYAVDTPHGSAVIVEHGFDCRKLLEKWGSDVTLKRDDLLCVYWKTKEVE